MALYLKKMIDIRWDARSKATKFSLVKDSPIFLRHPLNAKYASQYVRSYIRVRVVRSEDSAHVITLPWNKTDCTPSCEARINSADWILNRHGLVLRRECQHTHTHTHIHRLNQFRDDHTAYLCDTRKFGRRGGASSRNFWPELACIAAEREGAGIEGMWEGAR